MSDPRFTRIVNSIKYEWSVVDQCFYRWITKNRRRFKVKATSAECALILGHDRRGQILTISGAREENRDSIKLKMQEESKKYVNSQPILPDNPANTVTLPEGVKLGAYMPQYANCVVDVYYVKKEVVVDQNGNERTIIKDKWLKQRRFFDEHGRVYQDIDYTHSNGETHFFPHVHLWTWIGDDCERSDPLPYVGANGESVLYRKKTQNRSKTMERKFDTGKEGDAWRGANGITIEDVEHVDAKLYSPGKFPRLNIRDVQILLSLGREFELEYKGIEGMCHIFWKGGWCVYAKWNEDGEPKSQTYVNEDLDAFAIHAVLGPYNLADVIEDCEITWYS